MTRLHLLSLSAACLLTAACVAPADPDLPGTDAGAERDLPAWATGSFVIFPEDGTCFRVQDITLDVADDGQFTFLFNGSDAIGEGRGQVRAGASPDEVVIVSEDGLGGLSYQALEFTATRRAASIRGLPRIDLVSDHDERFLMVARPDIDGVAFPEEARGLFHGVTLTRDYFADDGGAPGALALAGQPVRVDGVDDAELHVITLGEGGAFGYGEQDFLFHDFRRDGVLESLGEPATVRFTGSYGLCMAEDGRGYLTFSTEGALQLDTFLSFTDFDDIDGDGDTAERLIRRDRLIARPVR
jgi:hypothetical protein